MLRISVGFTMGFALWLFETTASAQCTKDIDCKGDRICQDGVCADPQRAATLPEAGSETVQPEPDTPDPAPTPSPEPVPGAQQAAQPSSTGWSVVASIVGFAGAAAVPALAIPSAMATNDAHDLYDSDECEVMGECDAGEDREATSWAFGIPAILTVAALGPVVFFGGRSARHHPAVDGSPGLRITGIATYGSSLTCAIAMVAVGLADERVPPALIAVTGGIGALSLLALSIDALVSRKEALEQSSATAKNEPALFPFFSPAITSKGSSGALAGMVVLF